MSKFNSKTPRLMKPLLLICVIVSQTLAYADEANKESTRLNNSGCKKYNQGQFELAIEDFTEAIKKIPECNLAYGNRMRAKSRLHDCDGVINDYEYVRNRPTLLVEISTTIPERAVAECYSKRGLLKEEKENHIEAIACFDEAIKLSPEAQYYHYRALAKQHAGKTKEANDDFEQEKRVRK